jgi:hypothetical protein
MVDTILGIRLVYFFGVTNLIIMALIFSTCRCMIGSKFVNDHLKKGWYKWLYEHHCLYWWIMLLSIVSHMVLAYVSFGLPR